MDITFVIEMIQLGIKYAPDVEQFVVKAKNFVAGLFGKGLITKQQQDSVHAHIDALAQAVNSGTTPPEFVVEQDPT